MKTRDFSYSALLACSLLFVPLTVPCVLAAPHVITSRAWRQERLNQALYVAVQKNNAQSVRSLLREGAQVNSFVSTSAPTSSHIPAFVRHKTAALQSPASSFLCVALDTPVPPHHTSHMPLWYPADRAAIVQSLVDAGATVHVRNAHGESPLLLAARYGHSQATVHTLLRAGADVNTQDRNGWTPLIWAVYENEPNTVHLLLTYHANPNKGAKEEYARNALSVTSNPKLITMLQQAGAKE